MLLDPEELKALFKALELWDKIRDGRLDTVEIAGKAAPSKKWPNATSYLLQHRNTRGGHACTTHRIIDPVQGSVHWDEADVKIGEVTLAKRALR